MLACPRLQTAKDERWTNGRFPRINIALQAETERRTPVGIGMVAQYVNTTAYARYLVMLRLMNRISKLTNSSTFSYVLAFLDL